MSMREFQNTICFCALKLKTRYDNNNKYKYKYRVNEKMVIEFILYISDKNALPSITPMVL